MLYFRFINTFFLLLLLYTKSSYQHNLGAKAEIQLYHDMSIIVYFTELPMDQLAYEIWFNNPSNYPYWENALCLAVVAGTPGLSNPNDEYCAFLPVYDAAGNKNPYEETGDDCIQEQIPINPCRDSIALNRKADCGSKLNVLPQYYTLTDSRYTGLTKLVTKKYRKIWLHPDREDTIFHQSMLVSYTDRNNSMAEWEQTLKCKNLDLGYGTLNDFTFYPINSDGTYDTSKFSSGAALIQINLFIILSAAIVAFINMLFNRNN